MLWSTWLTPTKCSFWPEVELFYCETMTTERWVHGVLDPSRYQTEMIDYTENTYYRIHNLYSRDLSKSRQCVPVKTHWHSFPSPRVLLSESASHQMWPRVGKVTQTCVGHDRGHSRSYRSAASCHSSAKKRYRIINALHESDHVLSFATGLIWCLV